MTATEVLKKYFGYDGFRGGQQELVSHILTGNDVLGIMPTGAGKSICFQLPALMLDGVTLVVSPLISLMKDQVGSLRQSGIPAAYINSSLTPNQMEKVLYNARFSQYKLLYVAPERLLSPDFLEFSQQVKIAMLTVDEAHCISQWGQDFRPSYAQIPEFISSLPKRPIVSAFTATATDRVQKDIIELLRLQTPQVLLTGFDRQNLYFEVSAPKNKMQALISFLHSRKDKSGIVYCSTRKTVEDVCEELNRQGFSASQYHAGLSDAERHRNQDDFLFDRVQIMVATNAFGMGIDKSNVAFVVHYNMPKDIESYYQEAGRAGRDGSEAECLLLYSGQDVRTNQWMIEHAKGTTYPDEETEQLLKERDRIRLREMTFYSTTHDCLRSFILKYFGETPTGFCGHCSNCNTNFEIVDVTEETQKILSCVVRMKERFGATMVIDVLRGSKNERILSYGLQALPTYGISQKNIHTLQEIIEYLVQNDYLQKDDGQYAVLRLGAKARDVLKGTAAVHMRLAKERVEEKKSLIKTPVPSGRELLFSRLKRLRQDIAKEQGVPAFAVFTDSSLVDMCVRIPTTPAQFLKVSGVGEIKLQRYGERFLQIISEFCHDKCNKDIVSEQEEPKPKRKKTPQKSDTELKLPTDEALIKIPLSQQPIPISILAKTINETLKSQEYSTITAVGMSQWLISKGYLQESTEGVNRAKVPTAKGAALGITQEERIGKTGMYQINLYSPSAQQFVIQHTCDALYYIHNKHEEQDVQI